MLPDFFFCYLFPAQQTTSSGIGHRVNEFFRIGNQYAECEKQQQQQQQHVGLGHVEPARVPLRHAAPSALQLSDSLHRLAKEH